MYFAEGLNAGHVAYSAGCVRALALVAVCIRVEHLHGVYLCGNELGPAEAHCRHNPTLGLQVVLRRAHAKVGFPLLTRFLFQRYAKIAIVMQ